MIQVGTYVNIIDNSGGKKGLCIRLIKNGRNTCRYGNIGDFILVVVKTSKSSQYAKAKKGEIHKAVILKTKSSKTPLNFLPAPISFVENGVVLVTKQNKLLGTRIFSPLLKSFKFGKFLKFVTLSAGLI